MAWTRSISHTTQHTCGGPVFGRKAPLGECRRCDELRFGLAPVAGWSDNKRRCEATSLAAIRAHDCKASECLPICTFGDR